MSVKRCLNSEVALVAGVVGPLPPFPLRSVTVPREETNDESADVVEAGQSNRVESDRSRSRTHGFGSARERGSSGTAIGTSKFEDVV
ncbi:hypothetical protein A0H81_13497 [Grifola frondosa]|uniref:Uncharacterized protein n=1 Tax=Grifola frondosa TaxID=5627 RepID=A0A1C7LPV5_GRIFR|nr:hypothetical protein A0H81_13497 [Grifola frondosa]